MPPGVSYIFLYQEALLYKNAKPRAKYPLALWDAAFQLKALTSSQMVFFFFYHKYQPTPKESFAFWLSDSGVNKVSQQWKLPLSYPRQRPKPPDIRPH